MLGTDSKTLLGVLFATSIVVANVTATKIAAFDVPFIGLVALPAGFAAIAVAFLCSDLLSELHGRDAAHRVVTGTVLSLGVAYGLVQLAVIFPAAPFYDGQSAYAAVLSGSSTIIVAAIITTLISQHVDVTVFHYIRSYTGHRLKFARNVGSTAVSQFIDTTVFITLAFVVLPVVLGGTSTGIGAAIGLIVGQYAVKLLVAVLDTPVFYVVTGLRERLASGPVSEDPA